jgi:hypothetical protein
MLPQSVVHGFKDRNRLARLPAKGHFGAVACPGRPSMGVRPMDNPHTLEISFGTTLLRLR